MIRDTRELRNCFGRYATGIAVVTLPAGPAHCGVTVNSFTSVSLEPPLVSFCLSRRSSLVPAFEAEERFAVNVLSASQADHSKRFAKPSLNSWGGVRFREDALGCAVLDGALASFSCRRFGLHEGGDHLIIVGEVVEYDIDRSAEPLVFYAGRYGAFLTDDPRTHALPNDAASQFVSYWG